MDTPKHRYFRRMTLAGLMSAAIVLGLASLPHGEGTVAGAASGKLLSQRRQVRMTYVPLSQGTRMSQVGIGSIEGLLAALEARGAKVEMSENELSGISTLQVKVDGLRLSPVFHSCAHCEPIVFEY